MAQPSHSLTDRFIRFFLIATGAARRDEKRYQKYKTLKENANRLMHVSTMVPNSDLFKSETQLKITREVNQIMLECSAIEIKFGRFAKALQVQDELTNS